MLANRKISPTRFQTGAVGTIPCGRPVPTNHNEHPQPAYAYDIHAPPS